MYLNPSVAALTRICSPGFWFPYPKACAVSRSFLASGSLQYKTPVQGSTIVVQGSTIVVQGSTIVVQGSKIVLQGSTIVIQGSSIVAKGGSIVVQGSK